MLNPHIFRAYDVRGRVGSDINPEVSRLVGRAYGTLIRNNGGRTMAVGQDNRESAAGLKAGFIEGARAAGLDIVDSGIVTTPILYFATAHWKLDGYANITGSHNPVEYNGVKMVHPGAAPLTEEEIQGLRETIERGACASGAGGLTTRSPRDDYFDTIAKIVRLERPLKVVADAGNGIAGVYGPPLLRRLGCEVIELHCESDGRFPNHLPDPEDPENVVDLQQKVVETGADLGLAWDGDADRVGVIDERGRRHEADLILVLLARDLLTRHPGRSEEHTSELQSQSNLVCRLLLAKKNLLPLLRTALDHASQYPNALPWHCSIVKILLNDTTTDKNTEASNTINEAESIMPIHASIN